MSAIIKFFLYSRKNKNSHLQHSSCSVQTQDYQISLKTRNIFCVAFKDFLTDVRAGGSSSSVSWGLWFLLTPAATKHNKVCTWFIQKWGCSSLHITEAAARAWPAEQGSLHWCYWESSHRVRVTSAELIAMPILRFFSQKYFWPWSEIFSSLLMSRRYCTAAQHPRKQNWTSVRGCINPGLLRLPGSVSAPVRTLPRQWLKSAWTYGWIIKCLNN